MSEKNVTITYFVHRIPEDPSNPGLESQELSVTVPVSEAAERVRALFNSDGTTSVHVDDIRRWAPDLVDGPLED